MKNHPQKEKRFTVLCVGADATVNGGIASVIKAYATAWRDGAYDFDFQMLKTSDYQHGSRVGNIITYIRALLTMTRLFTFSRQYKVVHLHASAYLSFYRKAIAAALCRIFRRKTILHLHSGKFVAMLEHRTLMQRAFFALGLRCADQVVVLSAELKRKFIEYYPWLGSRISTIPNPIPLPDSPQIKHGHDDGKLDILFIGYFFKLKGIHDLLALAAETAHTHKNWRFHVAGMGEMQPQVDAAAALPDANVIFHGWADDAKKTTLYQKCDLLFLPTYIEGMPMVVLEAMSRGLPIVSTAVGGIPDVMENAPDAGRLLNPGDVAKFIQAFEYFSAPGNLEAGSRAALERIKNFGCDTVFSRVAAIYERLEPPPRRAKSTYSDGTK